MMCMAATGRSWAKKGETLKLKLKLGQKTEGGGWGSKKLGNTNLVKVRQANMVEVWGRVRGDLVVSRQTCAQAKAVL